MKRTGHWMASGLLLCMAVTVLTGCGSAESSEEWIPPCSALQMPKGGPVTETLVETLDQSYYDSAELEKTIRDAVNDYDAAMGTQAVEVVSYEAEGGAVRLVMNYPDMTVYNDFNQVKFFNGPILEAQMEEFLFDTEFYHVAGGEIDSDPLPGTVPVSYKQYQVAICDPFYAVEVPGDIVYVSTNARPEGKRIAVPDPENGTGSYLYVIYEF